MPQSLELVVAERNGRSVAEKAGSQGKDKGENEIISFGITSL